MDDTRSIADLENELLELDPWCDRYPSCMNGVDMSCADCSEATRRYNERARAVQALRAAASVAAE